MTGPQVGVRAPLQARSRDSARRLVDAALRVLARDGIQGLTMAAVSRESGVSNGSLYHRYGGRDQLLAACQERFFERIVEERMTAGTRLMEETDPQVLLTLFIEGFDEVFVGQGNLFQAFLIGGYANETLRARGREFTRVTAELFTDLFAQRAGCSAEAADMAYRLLFGRAMLAVMFDEPEVSALEIPAEVQRRYARDAAAAILGLDAVTQN